MGEVGGQQPQLLEGVVVKNGFGKAAFEEEGIKKQEGRLQKSDATPNNMLPC